MGISEAAKQKLAEHKERRAERRRQRQTQAANVNVFSPGREVVWRPQPGPQTALLTCPYSEILYGGARGGGKSLPFSSNIIVPGGLKLMKDVCLGDKVVSPTAGTAVVVGVYPQGVMPIWRMQLEDGISARATADHLWRVMIDGVDQILTTDLIREAMNRGHKARIPVGDLNNWQAILSIKEDGQEPAQCIKLDTDDGLFLTDHNIVTHNTDGCIGLWLFHAAKYGEHAKGVFFRRRFKQLEQVQERCAQLFPKLGALYNKGDATWVFTNGATLKLRHLWDVADCEAYQGHNYSMLIFEEATNWSSPEPINRLRGILRSAHGVPVKLVLTANPGGSGHNWVRARYLIPCLTGYKPIVDAETGETRVYIPARLEDNQILTKSDPFYENRLLQSGNSAIVRAWRWGDWSIVSGGFFDDLIDIDRHIIRPFEIPPTWRWRRSFDWGSASPASLGIWAISDGNPVEALDGFVFPRGSFIRVSEWYTCARDSSGNLRPNEGLRLTNIALGNGIGIRSQDRNFTGCVADPSIFARLGREAIYDEIRKGALEVGHHLIFQPADNNRIAGWQRVRDMLEAAAQERPEKPGLWAFETCEHYARTIPVLQRDESNPDDIDTDQEDHVADEVRYLCATGARTLSIGTRRGE